MERILSLRHLLVLSIALNVGLLLRTALLRDGCRSGRRDISLRETAAHVGSVRGEDERDVVDDDRVIDVDHGDPKMYQSYWQKMGDRTTLVLSGWQSISYFSDPKSLCWFLELELANAVTRLHNVVGNAVTADRHIVVGTGSSQLYLAALFALSNPDNDSPTNIVCEAPFYSSYPLMTDFLKSGLFKWRGDAREFEEEGPYIELVTSPNNPDGMLRKAVGNQSGGFLVYDLAYYWPQYAPIASPMDQDLMLFTVSKSTGHAGIRIGWALVKDEDVARKMTKFIEINTIGVSKDSQLRAAKILHAVADSCEPGGGRQAMENFFEFSDRRMEERWRKLRAAVERSGQFSLPHFSSEFCAFSKRECEPQPAFAWLKCEGEGSEDCEGFLRGHNIWTRGGRHFGESPSYVRVSMLDEDENFDIFVQRLSMISSS